MRDRCIVFRVRINIVSYDQTIGKKSRGNACKVKLAHMNIVIVSFCRIFRIYCSRFSVSSVFLRQNRTFDRSTTILTFTSNTSTIHLCASLSVFRFSSSGSEEIGHLNYSRTQYAQLCAQCMHKNVVHNYRIVSFILFNGILMVVPIELDGFLSFPFLCTALWI